MAITVRGATATNGGYGNNTNTVIAVPSGTVAGDLLVLILQVSKESTAAPGTPTGFTQIGNTATATGSGANGASKVCYRFATSEPASYTLTGGTGGGTMCPFMFSLNGVDTTTPFDVNPVWVTTTAASSIAVSAAGAVLLTCHAVLSSTAPSGWTTPSGMTARATSRSGNYENAAVFSQTISAAGSTGTKTSTPSGAAISGSPQAMSLAVRAAAADTARTTDFFPFLGLGGGMFR